MNTASSVTDSAQIALLRSSAPTCGPTTNRSSMVALASMECTTSVTRGRIVSSVCPGTGGRRIDTSRELPKFCTDGSSKPACSNAVRIWSSGAAPVNVACTLMPPVKSIARFSPRVANDTTDARIMMADSVYQIRRVAMNGKFVCLWKNSIRAVPSSL